MQVPLTRSTSSFSSSFFFFSFLLSLLTFTAAMPTSIIPLNLRSTITQTQGQVNFYTDSNCQDFSESVYGPLDSCRGSSQGAASALIVTAPAGIGGNNEACAFGICSSPSCVVNGALDSDTCVTPSIGECVRFGDNVGVYAAFSKFSASGDKCFSANAGFSTSSQAGGANTGPF